MKIFIGSLIACLALNFAQATETKLMVRAKAKDAKFIGTSIGGAYVVVKNKANGSILAEGTTTGSTGNTNTIMKEAHQRFRPLADDKTAGFLAVLDLDAPLLIAIEVIAPFNQRQAQVQVSTEIWVIPGKHIMGDGIVLEIPGMVIDILAPRTHQFISKEQLQHSIVGIEANIVMMCGCTISKGGLWNSEDIEVKVLVSQKGQIIKEQELEWAENNLFRGDLSLEEVGTYELVVYAYNEKTGNTGVDKVNFILNK